jgi:enterochelin esterase family protein
VTFCVPDPERRLAGVRLWQEAGIPGDLLDFDATPDGWQLTLRRPPVARLEYLLELAHPDGVRQLVPDPSNPTRAAGAFGDKSVVEFPGYRRPAWLAEPEPPGRRRTLEVAAGRRLDDASVEATLWSPSTVPDDEPAPLLVVHDGPEYDALAGLTHYLGVGVSSGRLPPLRAALLSPGHRDAWYSANDDYGHALGTAVLPALTGTVPTTVCVGMGTSLGALAMLHAHRRHPDSFDALFLQSGSFFHPEHDAQEQGFAYFRRIVHFVREVLGGASAPRVVPTVLVCGATEENVENNRLMSHALAAQGYDVSWREVPDLHNYTAWRDGFDPHLTELLARLHKPAGEAAGTAGAARPAR